MAQVVGYITSIKGKYFAGDKSGKIRELQVGDEIYIHEKVFGKDPASSATLELVNNERIVLVGREQYEVSALEVPKEPEEALVLEDNKGPDNEKTADESTGVKTDSSEDLTTPLNEAVGYELAFQDRIDVEVNVDATLRNAEFVNEKDIVNDNGSTGSILPSIVSSVNSVDDDFYDVSQAGGPTGTNTATNSFTFDAQAGVKSLQVGDTVFSKSDLENIAGKTVNMDAGILTFDSYTKDGYTYTLHYTYTTNDNYDHDVDSDVFVDTVLLVITDVGGREATGSISVNVVDDTPTSEDDVNSITEGQDINQIDGNLFLGDANGGVADHLGADDSNIDSPVITIKSETTETVGTVGAELKGAYGTMTLQSDGSYQYILDNTNPDVKALEDGETLDELFTYEIIDSDGDTVSATLDITINGSSSDPVIVIDDGTVKEAALDVIGTDPTSNEEVVEGKITGTSNDGFSTLLVTSSDGSTLSITELKLIDGTQTVDTPYGTLTLLSYVETSPSTSGEITGEISYRYTLNTAVTNTLASDSLEDILSVVITDVNGDATTNDLTITIEDDRPIAVIDENSITEDTAEVTSVSGNVLINDNDGADTNTAPITAQSTAGKYGDFVLNADGSYTYTLDNDNPDVNALNNGETLTDTLDYIITDADGDTDTAKLYITINGFTDPQLKVEDVTVVEDGTSGDMQVVFTINMDAVSSRDVTFDYTTVDGTALDGKEYTHLSGTATILAGQTTATVTVTLGADDYVADSGKTFDLQISNVNSAGAILDATGTSTITDDSLDGTPYDNADVIEDSQEEVTLKLIAVDSEGNPTASSVVEGNKAYYKVIVVDSSDNPVVDKDGNPATGTVNVLVSDGTATAMNPIAGFPGDYDGTSPLVVDVNTVFSIDTINDWTSDDGETFSVAIAGDQSYTNATDYENVTHDTTAVVTTITDDSDITTLNLSGDSSVVEGNTATYTLTLDHAPESDLIVTVSVVNVDTVDGDFDFSAPETKTQDITILAGQTTATFTIDTADDTVYEGDEKYDVKITGTSGGAFENLVVETSTVETSITDVADIPEITISDITVVEDGSDASGVKDGQLKAIFTVNISNGVTSTEDINFTFATSDGTALAGEDYTAILDGAGTISKGQTSVTIEVPLTDDYFADDMETFNVTITPVTTLVTVGSATATATIDDNSLASSDEFNNDGVTLQLVAVDNTGTELGLSNSAIEGYALFYKVKLVDKDGNDVLDSSGDLASGTVDLQYTDASATGGDDYINTLTTVEINKVVSVATLNDVVAESDETFKLSIVDNGYSNETVYEQVNYDTTSVISTITDGPTSVKDVVYVNLVDDASVAEADDARLTHTFVFKKADGTEVALGTGKQVTVTLNYINDTTSDEDFQSKQTTIVITGDGSSSYTFSNIVADDFLKEGSESYTLELNTVSDDNNYFEALLPLTFGRVIGTINDESTPDLALVSITADQVITEGDNSQGFVVSVNQDAVNVTSDITVKLTYSGVAQDGVDYVGVAEVVIVAGSNNTRFSIPTINDKIIEGSEDFTITIDAITDTNFEAIAPDPAAPSVTNTIWDDVDANPDTNALKEGGNQVIGNLLTNDEVGVNGKVTAFTYTDESGVTQNGVVGVEANTQYGRITVEDNGKYTYYSDTTPENHPSDGDTDTAILPDIINYTVTDDNGDSDSSTLTVNVSDTIGSIGNEQASSVDEGDLVTSGTSTVTNIHLGINANTDGVESITFDLNDIQTALADLTSHGVALTYTLSASDQVLTASAGTTEVFVVTLNQAGIGSNPSSYDFELKAPIDHLNSSGGKLDNLDIKIPFEYKEIGATEDTVKGNLTVNVIDDTPTAIVDAEATVVEGTVAPIAGNVLLNDDQGADGALLHDFQYTDVSGTVQDKYFSDTVSTYTVDTATGSLIVNQDGSWSFTAHTYVDHDDAIQGSTHVGDGSDNDSTQGSFYYRLQDYDTDNSNYVKQVIHVTDGADPSSSGVTNAVDEDDIVGSGSDQAQSALVSGILSVTGGSDPVDVTLTTTDSNTLTSNGVNITYVLSDNGHTLNGMAGSVEIFEVIITTPTVNNPAYTFELKGQIDHPDADGENTQDITVEYLTTDIDGDTVTSDLVVTVTDDVSSIGTPDDGAVDESGLPSGATPDPSQTIATGSLAVSQEADTIDTVFDAATIASLGAQNLQATFGNNLNYVLSNSGHTLTASYDGKDYFSVDIKDPTTNTASYEFTLTNAIYESVSGGTTNINIPFSVNDFDKDSTSSSFNVVVTDDPGSGDKQLLVNEDGSIVFSVTSDDIKPQADYITEHGRISFDDATNLFTYTPDPDYSGMDNGIVLNYVVGFTSFSVNVDVVVNPISDAPTLSVDAPAIEVDEDSAVALGFNVPVVKDNFDQNSTDTAPNLTDGDNSERVGVITLSGIPNGATVYYGTTTAVMDGTPKTVIISDLDENGDGVSDHISGLSADYVMTKAQFEALQIIPPLNSGDNMTVEMSVTSYEVDDAGVQLAGVTGKTSTQTLDIDVHAKTDAGVAIIVADISGNEDEWMRIDDAITITKTLDVDGSEVYELVFDGGALPTGTLYYQGTPADMSDRSIGTDASGGFSVTISNIDDFIAGSNPVYIMTPVNDSTDIKDLKVTVNVHDTDADSTPATDVVKSASDYVDVEVLPLANDITVTTTGASGDEDTLIDFNLQFTNSDAPLEKVVSVTIDGVPDGAIIYEADGTTVVLDNSAGGNNSITIETPTGDVSAIEAFKILPPAHSSQDITLQVSMEIKDFDDDGSANTDTQTTAPVDVTIEVLAVTETDKSDTADPAGADVAIHANHYFTAFAEEDTYFDLNSVDFATNGFKLLATNEDDSAMTPHGSETTTIVFTNLLGLDAGRDVISLDNAVVKYNDGSSDIELTFSATGEVEVPIAYLDTIQIKPPKDYAGTFTVDTFVRTQDSDEDTGTKANVEETHHSVLAINVNPVVDDNPNVNISQSVGQEDDGRISDGKILDSSASNGIELKATISSLDSDGSEVFRVFFDKIPEDAALYYKGHIIYANSANAFESDGIIVTDNGDGTFKAQLEDYDATISAKIIPPHNSDVNITLVATAQTIDTAILADGTVVEVVGDLSAPQNVVVDIQAKADNVVFTELKTFDITQDASISTGDQFVINEKLDGSGAYNLIVEEDSRVSGNGADIELKELFISSQLIDSYDNIASNKVDVSPVYDTSVSTENVTITLSNLESDYDVNGAILVSGTGIDRVWTMTLDELKAGNVSVSTPKNFSGEVDFDIKFISAENSGDAQENPTQNIKVLVTPVAEDLTNVPLETLEVNEDVLEGTYVDFIDTLPDDNGNPESINEFWVKVADVTGKDFKLFYDDGTTQYNEVSTVVGSSGISVETIGADTYYHFENDTFRDLYIQYDSDLGTSTDTDIDIKFTLKDYIDIDGQTIANISDRIDSTYTMNLNAVTDDIDAQGTSITDTDGDATADIGASNLDINGDGVNDDMTFSPTDNTQVTINIAIVGVDMPNEVDIDTATAPNSIDDDSSEQIISLRIDGVPKGIGIEDGYYAGDKDLDGDGTTEYTGIWYVDLDPNNPAFDMDADGASYDLKLNIAGDKTVGHEIAGTITVSFINQDGAASTTQDSVSIIIDDSMYVPTESLKIPMDILEWNFTDHENVMVEDETTMLGELVNFSVNDVTVGAGTGTYDGITDIAPGTDVDVYNFSITVEGLSNATVSGVGWNQDSSSGTFWTYQGSGKANIQAALNSLIITPNKDYNQNHDIAKGDTDTPAAFNDGPLKFTTTLTTYAENGYSDSKSLNYVGNVKPVTDDPEINETFDFTDVDGAPVVEALEDGSVAIHASITSVDDPYLSAKDSFVTIKNISADNIGVIVADGSNERLDGYIKYTSSGGWVALNKGASVEVPLTEIDTVEFKLGEYIAGNVSLEYSMDLQEKGSAPTIVGKDTVEFYVNPVADGLNMVGAEIIGNEDEYIELTSLSGSSFDALGALVDPTEELNSIVVDGVPNGYLVYYGDNHEYSASVIGVDARGFVSFDVPISGGTPPKIWVLPPENIGGVSSIPKADWELVNTINVKVGVDDMGVTVFDEKPVLLNIKAIADEVTINPANASGAEGEQIALNFNTTVIDTDKSEQLIVTLAGLGDDAVFYLDGVEIDMGYVTYDKTGDTYTIDNKEINYTNVSNITFIQNNFSGDVTTTVVAKELSNGDTYATPATATFTVNITQQDGSPADDTLFFDEINGNDGFGATDTLVFGYNYSKESIDFTMLDDGLTKNIEVLDLIEHGDHEVILSATDVEAMTDANNTLTIESDSGDNIVFADSALDADDVWAQIDATNSYESAKGATVTVNGSGSIDESAVVASAGDDVLGYNDTNSVDGGFGEDRVIIFDGVSLDFAKLSDIETIDLSVVGDHDLGEMKLSDVIAMTDSRNALTIMGDDANDQVSFSSADSWQKEADQVQIDGKDYDVYTNTNDLTVKVNVEENVNDQII